MMKTWKIAFSTLFIAGALLPAATSNAASASGVQGYEPLRKQMEQIGASIIGIATICRHWSS